MKRFAALAIGTQIAPPIAVARVFIYGFHRGRKTRSVNQRVQRWQVTPKSQHYKRQWKMSVDKCKTDGCENVAVANGHCHDCLSGNENGHYVCKNCGYKWSVMGFAICKKCKSSDVECA